MIPQEIIYVLMGVCGISCIYPFTDMENRVYANIIVAIFASVLAFYIGMNLITGNVFIYDTTVASTNTITVEDVTTISYEYYDATSNLQNPALMWFFILIGIIMALISFLMIAEVVMEKRVQGVGIT